MENNNQNLGINSQSRRLFISKAGLLTGGVIIGSIELLSACSFFASNTDESRSNEFTMPPGVSRIENMEEVKIALRNEREQFQSLTQQLIQLQLDMDEQYVSFERLQDVGDMSQERMLVLQVLMDKKDQVEKVLSNILKVFQNTQRDLVSNLK